jgi:hypothetical protein
VIFLIAVLGVLAVLALAGWGATLVLMSRALLPYANGMAVLSKLDDLKDEKIRGALAAFKKRDEGEGKPSMDSELAEIRRRAQALGFQVDGDGRVDTRERSGSPLTPPPDVDTGDLEVVE